MASDQRQKSPWHKILWATVNPRWNVKFRPPVGAIAERRAYAMPVQLDKYAAQLEADTFGGRLVRYGSSLLVEVLGDQAPDSAFQVPDERRSIEHDSYIIAPWWHPHPLFTLGLLALGAKQRGHKLTPYKPKIMLMWKRLRIDTPAGQFDLSVLPHSFDMAKIAQDVDLNLCALVADRKQLLVTDRHEKDVADLTLTFRPMNDNPRDRLKHPHRRTKYEKKFPGWKVKYGCVEDAVYFSKGDASPAVTPGPA